MTRKLVRSNCTTAQVVAALTKHPDWTAEAPETPESVGPRAWMRMLASGGLNRVVIHAFGEPIRVIPNRSDWSIYRPEKKRKVRELDTIFNTTAIKAKLIGRRGDSATVIEYGDLDPSKTYRLLLVEVPE